MIDDISHIKKEIEAYRWAGMEDVAKRLETMLVHYEEITRMEEADIREMDELLELEEWFDEIREAQDE